jgi:histidinol dehydrogenase
LKHSAGRSRITDMKIVEGFLKARPLLTRGVPAYEAASEAAVKNILADVRANGDKALISYTRKLDGVELKSLEVTKKEIADARKQVNKDLTAALKLAAGRIERFHRLCKARLEPGFLIGGLGCLIRPLNRVGIYVPGGTAVYPSTVLMTAIPARVAGVKEIFVVTPPQKNGTVPAPTLLAADIASVDRIFKIGGAQAIAALAYGTWSVPRVDKICGPGNIFVVTAKRMAYGAVGIESLPGPSEIIIVADDTADVSFCAADLIAQAEHDPLASAILITTSKKLAAAVDREIEKQLAGLKRKSVAAKAFKSGGLIAVVKTPEEAIELVNLYAPEHVSLMLRDAGSYAARIENAGCIFIGGGSPVALGDYVAGPSHVLPTSGSARFSSPLGIQDFLKITNVIGLEESEINELGKAAITMAESEGLKGHAQAIRLRLNGSRKKKK